MTRKYSPRICAAALFPLRETKINNRSFDPVFWELTVSPEPILFNPRVPSSLGWLFWALVCSLHPSPPPTGDLLRTEASHHLPSTPRCTWEKRAKPFPILPLPTPQGRLLKEGRGFPLPSSKAGDQSLSRSSELQPSPHTRNALFQNRAQSVHPLENCRQDQISTCPCALNMGPQARGVLIRLDTLSTHPDQP